MNLAVELSHYEPTDIDLQPMVEHVLIRRGSPCPRCGDGKMDYNGLLELECDQCGYSLIEGAGCG